MERSQKVCYDLCQKDFVFGFLPMVVFSFQLHLRCRRSEASFSFASKKMSFLRAHRAQTSRFPQERGWTSCSLLAVPLTFAPPSRPFWVGSSWGMASSFLLKLCPILGLYLYGAVLPPLGPNAGQQQVERSELQHAERRPLQPAPRGNRSHDGGSALKENGGLGRNLGRKANIC